MKPWMEARISIGKDSWVHTLYSASPASGDPRFMKAVAPTMTHRFAPPMAMAAMAISEITMPAKNALLRYLPPAMDANTMLSTSVTKLRMMPKPVARDWAAPALENM